MFFILIFLFSLLSLSAEKSLDSANKLIRLKEIRHEALSSFHEKTTTLETRK
jgi:hypothetical protein